MSNILKIPFNRIREESQYKIIFKALERGFIKLGIDFYLVGATARDIWMKGVQGLPPKRATRDIDFGIMIKDSDVFDDLKRYLIDEEGFIPVKGNEFVLIWKDQTQVDLIPFGELEREGIRGILENGLDESNNLAELFASESYGTIDYSKSLISHILKGISDIISV